MSAHLLRSAPAETAVATILVIEDQRDLAFGLRANLEVEGYVVEVAHTGEDGLRMLRTVQPALVLLDLMLPDIEGYEVLARLRADGHEMPVLILTARGEELDKVRGFRLGADDYVTKPFGVMELVVRIEAVLRRSGGGPPAPRAPARIASLSAAGPATWTSRVHRFGDIDVDEDAHHVLRSGRSVSLTPKAFELLVALVRKRGQVATRVELLRDVWGYSSAVTTRTVDTHIAELRRKLEDNPAEPTHILTVWKVGYRLQG